MADIFPSFVYAADKTRLNIYPNESHIEFYYQDQATNVYHMFVLVTSLSSVYVRGCSHSGSYVSDYRESLFLHHFMPVLNEYFLTLPKFRLRLVTNNLEIKSDSIDTKKPTFTSIFRKKWKQYSYFVSFKHGFLFLWVSVIGFFLSGYFLTMDRIKFYHKISLSSPFLFVLIFLMFSTIVSGTFFFYFGTRGFFCFYLAGREMKRLKKCLKFDKKGK